MHIEVVNRLDTDSSMMAITIIQGETRQTSLINDDGTKFVGAARKFRHGSNDWDRVAISGHFARSGIVWKLNPPGAQKFGGIWERLVHTCKKAMIAILGNRRLTWVMLKTTMSSVDQTLNARPLAPVSDDSEDLEALTPNHFLWWQNH